MGDRITPWPVEALPLREIIQKQNERLGRIVGICLSDGMDEHNYGLVKLLLPKAMDAAGRAMAAARDVQRYDNRARGRAPKWSNVAMDISSLIMASEKLLEQAGEDLQIHYFSSVEHALKVVYQITKKIERKLAEIPAGDIPPAFIEILSEVLQ